MRHDDDNDIIVRTVSQCFPNLVKDEEASSKRCPYGVSEYCIGAECMAWKRRYYSCECCPVKNTIDGRCMSGGNGCPTILDYGYCGRLK